MRKFERCVLLTRVGSFYELYFEQAERYGPLLNLKVAQKKTNAGPVSMAGFPFFQLDRFLKTLVQELEQHVAISEEVPNTASPKSKSGGLLFDRRVSRIVTPGTLIDERFMNTSQNNYLLAVSVYPTVASEDTADSSRGCEANDGECKAHISRPPAVGLAWLDLSTGDFFTQSTNLCSLQSAIARIGAREIILHHGQETSHHPEVSSILEEHRHVTSHRPSASIPSSADAWNPRIESPMSQSDAQKFTAEEIGAGTCLLDYVEVQLQGLQMRLQRPIRRQAEEIMSIDKNSMRALEIKSTLRDGVLKGSLLHTMQLTVTNSGARLLSDWLTAPSTSLAVINGRLDLVSFFLEDETLREKITQSLGCSHDSQRLVQKFSLGRGDPEDLVSLSKTIVATREISTLLGQSCRDATDQFVLQSPSCVKDIMTRFDLDEPALLADRISRAIDDEGLMRRQRLHEDEAAGVIAMAQEVATSEGVQPRPAKGQKTAVEKSGHASATASASRVEDEDVWVMRRSASTTLSRLHDHLDKLVTEKAELEHELRLKHGANTLTLRWTPGLGHICHVKGKDIRSSLSSADKIRSVSASKSTKSFHLPEWTALGTRLDQAKLQIRAEEQHVFRILRDEVISNLAGLRRNAAVLDELDIACACANLADERGLVRPLLNSTAEHKIFGGRHPTVERGLEEQGRNFIANDCSVGERERIWLITGPNMGGKSTFLRQNALISIMAQAGSFVPASYAEIGIVDQIYSRIGSADNLYQDQSTFMVEMLETANILKQATPRSFVIMDEVGRGTTSDDGVAVAYACLDHLYHVNRCRALFATHFHELADMTKNFEHVACYCTDIAEDNTGAFSYVHRLRQGVNKQSHALKVARIAGLPDRAIATAAMVLKDLSRVK